MGADGHVHVEATGCRQCSPQAPDTFVHTGALSEPGAHQLTEHQAPKISLFPSLQLGLYRLATAVFMWILEIKIPFLMFL